RAAESSTRPAARERPRPAPLAATREQRPDQGRSLAAQTRLSLRRQSMAMRLFPTALLSMAASAERRKRSGWPRLRVRVARSRACVASAEVPIVLSAAGPVVPPVSPDQSLCAVQPALAAGDLCPAGAQRHLFRALAPHRCETSG